MNGKRELDGLFMLLRRKPDARAEIFGGRTNPELCGSVELYSTPVGLAVYILASGLPMEGGLLLRLGRCGGEHPLISAGGRALSLFLTDAVGVGELIGTSAVIAPPDADGIACGKFVKC